MMAGFLGATYDWVKAAHVIFVIFWMAGLFMLPRYLVYHQEGMGDPAEAARWIDRETKLRHIILTPAMIVVWVLGLALGYAKKLARGQATAANRTLRMLNEVPAIGAVLIVVLVIVKPF